MKKLILIVLLPLSTFANPVSTWQNAAHGAILEYFQNSNRTIKTFNWLNISIVDREDQEFLIEADVVAKSITTQVLRTYHCGVFAQKVNQTAWKVLVTTCETFADQFK